MAKKFENEVMEQLKALNEAINAMNSRIDALEGKGKKSEAPKKQTASKSKSKSKSKSNDFDRALYEETAKKLGVFYKGTVCATVKDGKVLATREENRAKVYKAMGLK